MASSTKLFQSMEIVSLKVSHRIVMAPLTRYPASDSHVPLDLVSKHYADRASTPGTLIITEATAVSPSEEAEANLPGIFTPEERASWSRIFDAVHARDSFIFQHLWGLSRAGDPDDLKSRGFKYASSSDIQLSSRPIPPEPFTEAEIWQKIAEFRNAAKNVIAAGGDGVEIHGAHGYLIDQFTRDSANKRVDSWGGSVENRARFVLDIVKAVVEEIGADRVALRLSPFAIFQESYSSDTWEQTLHLIRELKRAKYKLAYLSLVEPRGEPIIWADPERPGDNAKYPSGSRPRTLYFILDEWNNYSPVVVAGGYTPESTVAAIDEHYQKWDVAVAFGRHFTSNPDLVFRVKNGIDLTPYNRETCFTNKSKVRYNDHPFRELYLQAAGY